MSIRTVNVLTLVAFGAVMLLVFSACRPPAGFLSEADPEAVDMSSDHLVFLDEVIGEAVSRKDFPGAVILIGRRDKIVFRKAYGLSRWIPDEQPMTPEMIFDLASITKPVATATSIMILVERGRLRLWDPVTDFIPQFKPYVSDQEDGGEEEGVSEGEPARLWHLLTHTSGLPPYCDVQELKEEYGEFCPTDRLVEHIAGLEKTDPAGEAFHYSCLGYITLAYILNQVTGQNIAEFSDENIFKPLGMARTFYRPADEYRKLCAPTEAVEGDLLQGVVHDPLARLQGGISGNAGLFSTAADLALFAHMILNRGRHEDKILLSPLTVTRMTEIFPRVSFSGRGLGWDLDSSYSTNGGDLFGPESFGHTGYTGTSLWIDPETESFIIFLTNRVHPDDSGEVTALRSKVANIVAASMDR